MLIVVRDYCVPMEASPHQSFGKLINSERLLKTVTMTFRREIGLQVLPREKNGVMEVEKSL